MKSKSRSKGRKGKKALKKKHRRSKKGSKKRHHKSKRSKSPISDCTPTTNVTTDDDCGQPKPKLISEALALDTCDDLAKFAIKPEDVDQNRLYSKYKFSSSEKAEVALNRTFHEAVANITGQFYGKYIPKLEACNCGDIKALLQNCPEPAALQETLRNGFNAYLTSTGFNDGLKRRLQTSINDVIQQRFQPPSSGSGDDKAHFAQDLYIYLTDRLEEALVESQIIEGPPVSFSTSNNAPSDLLTFAEEAQIFGDIEVAQRLHLRRICGAPEDPQPWIDYSIFWSSSACGDDQLAELAVREALALDPENVIALVLLGIIAARNRDPRAVPLIGHAVKLRPLAPELVVVLATAYRVLGLDLEAQYFYLKARYIMLKLTGQDTRAVEVALDRVYQLQPAKLKRKKKKKKSHERKTKKRSTSKKKKSSKSPTGKKRQKKSKKSRKKEKKDKKSPVTQILEDQINLVSDSSKAKGEIQVPMHVSCYDVPIEVGEESVQTLMDVGPLPRSLWITWDVTRPYGVAVVDGAEVQPSGWESKRCQQRSEEVFGSKMALSSAQLSKAEVVREQIEFYAFLKGQEAWETSSEKRVKSSKSKSRKNKSQSKSKSRKKKSKSPKSKKKSKSKSHKKKSRAKKSKSPKSDSEVSQSHQYAILQRHGSEYIWAAQLLLHLKAFDFLDLVFAKELYLTQGPSVPFLYLVSTSMMIRSQFVVAQKLLGKILKVPEMSQNPHVLALQGLARLELCDCCGAKADLIKAIQCAGSDSSDNNFLLAHLKLANLYANLGEYEVSKSLFLKTVSQYPSLYSWILLGDVCYRHEEFKNAEIAYSQANKLDSTNPTIWGMLSLISIVQGNRVLAEQAFKWASRFGLDPNGRIMEALRVLQELKGYGDPFVVTPRTVLPPTFRRYESGDDQKPRVIVSKHDSVEDQQLRYKLLLRIKGCSGDPAEQ